MSFLGFSCPGQIPCSCYLSSYSYSISLSVLPPSWVFPVQLVNILLLSHTLGKTVFICIWVTEQVIFHMNYFDMLGQCSATGIIMLQFRNHGRTANQTESEKKKMHLKGKPWKSKLRKWQWSSCPLSELY